MIINFIENIELENKNVILPKSSEKFLPEWYKKIPFFKNKKISIDNNGIVTNKTIKQCMPFYDALSSGYMVSTWCDIEILKKETKTYLKYKNEIPIADSRDLKINFGEDIFYEKEFVWLCPWNFKTPKNFSCLITHPLNRLDLPFYTLSAIIDSDNYHHSRLGKIPFYIKKDFEGIIPAGTPMFQVIPIKRENWKLNIIKFNEKNVIKFYSKILKHFYGSYKKNFWVKKHYL